MHETFTAPARFTIHPEATYNRGSNKTSDWIVEDTDALIFVECKAKRMTLAAKTEMNYGAELDGDLEKIAGYVLQMYKQYRDYKNNRYNHIRYDANKKVILQLVSMEEWYINLGPFLDKLKEKILARLTENNIDPVVLTEAPYFMSSISDIERNFPYIHNLGIPAFYSGMMANTIQETMKTISLRNPIIDEFQREFQSFLGVNIPH